MKQFAIIESGVVVNVVMAASVAKARIGLTAAQSAVPVKAGAVKGASYTNGQFTPPEPPLPAPTVQRVKLEANRRILKIADDKKQINAIADGLAMLNARVEALLVATGTTDPLTAEELARANAYLALWARINPIRQASNTIEQDIQQDVENDPRWPAGTNGA